MDRSDVTQTPPIWVNTPLGGASGVARRVGPSSVFGTVVRFRLDLKTPWPARSRLASFLLAWRANLHPDFHRVRVQYGHSNRSRQHKEATK